MAAATASSSVCAFGFVLLGRACVGFSSAFGASALGAG